MLVSARSTSLLRLRSSFVLLRHAQSSTLFPAQHSRTTNRRTTPATPTKAHTGNLYRPHAQSLAATNRQRAAMSQQQQQQQQPQQRGWLSSLVDWLFKRPASPSLEEGDGTEGGELQRKRSKQQTQQLQEKGDDVRENQEAHQDSKDKLQPQHDKEADDADDADDDGKKGDPRDGRKSYGKKNTREDGMRLRKMALLMGFNGSGYYGMQRNHGFATIEETLLKALLECNLIPKAGYGRAQTLQFQRTARTDKNVSAARQIVSLQMFPEANAAEKLNEKLPPEIKIFWVARVTKGFNAKKACTSRRYEYLLPTYALCPKEQPPRVSYRTTKEQLETFQNILNLFVGTHRFHNYTSQKAMTDPSCFRYIYYFQCLEPFERDGMEWVRIHVKGQSFMLHQIRKMIGMAVAVTKGYAEEAHVYASFNKPFVPVPRIPGIGLLLDSVFFDHYNRKYAKTHEELVFDRFDDAVEAFKADKIVGEIVREEKENAIIRSWLSSLYHHNYSAETEYSRAEQNQDKDKDTDKDQQGHDQREHSTGGDDGKGGDNVKEEDGDRDGDNASSRSVSSTQ